MPTRRRPPQRWTRRTPRQWPVVKTAPEKRSARSCSGSLRRRRQPPRRRRRDWRSVDDSPAHRGTRRLIGPAAPLSARRCVAADPTASARYRIFATRTATAQRTRSGALGGHWFASFSLSWREPSNAPYGLNHRGIDRDRVCRAPSAEARRLGLVERPEVHLRRRDPELREDGRDVRAVLASVVNNLVEDDPRWPATRWVRAAAQV